MFFLYLVTGASQDKTPKPREKFSYLREFFQIILCGGSLLVAHLICWFWDFYHPHQIIQLVLVYFINLRLGLEIFARLNNWFNWANWHKRVSKLGAKWRAKFPKTPEEVARSAKTYVTIMMLIICLIFAHLVCMFCGFYSWRKMYEFWLTYSFALWVWFWYVGFREGLEPPEYHAKLGGPGQKDLEQLIYIFFGIWLSTFFYYFAFKYLTGATATIILFLQLSWVAMRAAIKEEEEFEETWGPFYEAMYIEEMKEEFINFFSWSIQTIKEKEELNNDWVEIEEELVISLTKAVNEIFSQAEKDS